MGIGDQDMAAVCRREAWVLALALVMAVRALPMGLEDGVYTLLSESEHAVAGTPNEQLSCHTVQDHMEKVSCCKEGLGHWRDRQALYMDYDQAETAKISAPEETEALLSAAEAAKAKWDQSETKRIFEEGVRQCTNSPNAYTLPEDATATASREAAQHAAAEKKESADAAADAANEAIARQGDAMADYVKVANSIDAENAKANAAEAESEKANIDKAQADEEVELSKQNALAADSEATDASASLDTSKQQEADAEQALETAKQEFEEKKAAMDTKIGELQTAEQDALDAKQTADDAAQAAQDVYDSKTDEAERATALATVEATKAEAEAKADAAVEATGNLDAQEQAKATLVSQTEAAITQMESEATTAQQDVAMAGSCLS